MQNLIVSVRPMILNLFEGEGGGAAPAGATGEATAAPANTRAGKSGENVLYGKQPESASDAGKIDGPQVTSDTAEAKEAEWRKMIEGDYKDMYSADVQRIINQRFKETKQLQQTVDSYQPILAVLARRYGENDPAKLAEKIDNDSAYWSEAADEAGMSVDQFKEFQRIKAENDQLKRAQERQQGEERANAQLQQWYSEAQSVKAKFPGFDLNAEVKNPQFQQLLRAGTPIELAYRVMHMDAMMTDAVQTAAAKTEQRVVANVRAKGARPTEAGASSQGGFTVKDDVSKLNKKDRAEIARRAMRGETIVF